MGWWPLDIELSGYGASTPQPESDLVWGDGPADIVDEWMKKGFRHLE